MSSIKVNDLNPAGSELFQDYESFMNELTNEELGSVQGGFSVTVTGTILRTWTWAW